MAGSPRASSPILFGHRTPSGELLPWEWAERRLVEARNYWIATTRPDGRPHNRPLWGVWLDSSFLFSTGSLAQHNLRWNDAVTVHLEDGDAALIVEGCAHPETDPAALQRMCDAYGPKYDWPMTPADDGIRDGDGAGGPVFRVLPDVVFGWDSGFRTQTRWQFDR